MRRRRDNLCVCWVVTWPVLIVVGGPIRRRRVAVRALERRRALRVFIGSHRCWVVLLFVVGSSFPHADVIRVTMVVSRSQTNKIRSLFLFVLDDDLLICSLISRAVVEPRYRISTLRSREITKCSNFQTTMTSLNIFLYGVELKVQRSGSLLTICLRHQHPFPHTLVFYHQIQLWYPTTSPQRRMPSTLPEHKRLLLAPKFGRKGRKKTSHSLMTFPPKGLFVEMWFGKIFPTNAGDESRQHRVCRFFWQSLHDR